MKIHSGISHNRPMAEINVIPFVDIVLVLLIIFMITAPFIQQGMSVELPQAASPEVKSKAEDLIVTVNQNGAIYLGDAKTRVALEELPEKLASIFQNKESKTLLIKADHQLLYGKVIQVMAAGLKAGVERIGMITQPEK